MKRKLLYLVCLTGILSACTVRGPEVEVRPPEVDIKPGVEAHDYHHSHPRSRHCPPGHAKKGWC